MVRRRKAVGFYTDRRGKVRPITAGSRRFKMKIKSDKPRKNDDLKVYEFDVWMTAEGKPEKIGKQWIPAKSKKEAFKILRTVGTDEPATYVYRGASPLKHFDYDAQLEYKESYEFYKKALKHNRGKKWLKLKGSPNKVGRRSGVWLEEERQ